MNPKRPAKRKKPNTITSTPRADPGLLDELRTMIIQAREGVARTVDAALTTLHRHIGRRIHEDILKNERVEYGREIVSALRRQLSTEFGQGFDENRCCAGKKRETVEYLGLGRSGIHVAEYLTELPPREVLRERFHQALAVTRERLTQRDVKETRTDE